MFDERGRERREREKEGEVPVGGVRRLRRRVQALTVLMLLNG